jgi:hypothetical protein
LYLRRIWLEKALVTDASTYPFCLIVGIVKAIEDGAYNATLKARLSALENEKVQAQAGLASIDPAPVLRLHPNLPALYRSKVEKLAEALSEPATAAEAADILRSLIERIVLTPKGDALYAELYGDFATIAAMAEGPVLKNRDPGSMAEPGLLSVVAGTRNQLYRTVMRR